MKKTACWDRDKFAECINRFGYFTPARRLIAYMEYLGGFIEPSGSRVLGAGGGDGVYSLWLGVRGARSVVCLEPFPKQGAEEKFGAAAEFLGLSGLRYERRTVQEYSPEPGERFDLLFLHNSVNHLDESACEQLHRDARARDKYTKIFSKLASMTAPGGGIALTDRSRRNIFPTLGLKHPLAPKIEWRKHQSPYLWARLLGDAGFTDPEIRWIPPRQEAPALQALDFLFTGSVGAFFTTSRFALAMKLAMNSRAESKTAVGRDNYIRMIIMNILLTTT